MSRRRSHVTYYCTNSLRNWNRLHFDKNHGHWTYRVRNCRYNTHQLAWLSDPGRTTYHTWTTLHTVCHPSSIAYLVRTWYQCQRYIVQHIVLHSHSFIIFWLADSPEWLHRLFLAMLSFLALCSEQSNRANCSGLCSFFASSSPANFASTAFLNYFLTDSWADRQWELIDQKGCHLGI